LIDWSKKSNKIAIGIDDQVYLWNSGTKTSIAIPEMTQTRTREEIFVTSVKWMPNKSEVLAVAMSDCTIYLCNIETGQCVGKILDHEYRVASLSWLNESVLSSGSFAGLVLNHDVRCCTKQEKKLSEWTFHQGKQMLIIF
jgi:WD40 repeat protein